MHNTISQMPVLDDKPKSPPLGRQPQPQTNNKPPATSNDKEKSKEKGRTQEWNSDLNKSADEHGDNVLTGLMKLSN